ncbi:MAG: DUF6580 family putative transport protein [Pseudomonadota bacterium]
MMLPFFIISFGILTRLIPHLPNFSPEIIFALYLGMKNTPLRASAFIILMAVISDLLLGFGIGSWALLTYSALLITGGVGFWIRKKGFSATFMGTSCAVTLGYWIWTNFGTWFITALYPHNAAGLVKCYTLALPFLANSLAASFAWCAIIVVCENYFSKKYVIEAV